MKRLLLVACVAWVGGPAFGQGMPGQPVGSGFVTSSTSTVNDVGTKLPAAGKPINLPAENALVRRYDPSKPLDVFKGTGIDPKSVAAPVDGYPGAMTQNPDLLDRLYKKLGTTLGVFKPDITSPTNVTPGIFRRNRERADERREQMWRRD